MLALEVLGEEGGVDAVLDGGVVDIEVFDAGLEREGLGDLDIVGEACFGEHVAEALVGALCHCEGLLDLFFADCSVCDEDLTELLADFCH